MNLKQKNGFKLIQFKKIATTVVLDALAKLLIGLTTLLLIRQLSSEDLGLYGLALAKALIVYQVVIYSLNQFELVTRLQRGLNTFLLQLILSLALLVLISPTTSGLLSLVAYFLGIVMIDSARLNRHLNNQYISFSAIELARNLIILLALLYLSKIQHLTVNTVFYVQGGSAFLFFGYLFLKSVVSLRRSSGFTSGLTDNWNLIKPHLALFFYFIIIGFIGQIEPFALNKFSTSTELSHFTVSQRLYVVMTTVLASINSVYLAESIFHNDIQKMTLQLNKHLKFIVTFLVPLTAVALIFGQPLYVFLVTPNYLSTYPIFCIMITIALIGLMFSPFVSLCILRKQFSFLFILSLISLILNLILNFALSAKYGALGSAWILLLTTSLITVGIFTKHCLTQRNLKLQI